MEVWRFRVYVQASHGPVRAPGKEGEAQIGDESLERQGRRHHRDAGTQDHAEEETSGIRGFRGQDAGHDGIRQCLRFALLLLWTREL